MHVERFGALDDDNTTERKHLRSDSMISMASNRERESKLISPFLDFNFLSTTQGHLRTRGRERASDRERDRDRERLRERDRQTDRQRQRDRERQRQRETERAG